MENHKCDACGFEFSAENPQLRALGCPQCKDGIARPESERTIREVWARVGDNHHRLFYAEGPATLLADPHKAAIDLALKRTPGTDRFKASADELHDYDGVAMIVNGEIVKRFGAFDLLEPGPEQAERDAATRGEVVVVEKGKPTAKRTRAVKRNV
jgi:hypothetical protein